ncbi:uncharacterized protein DEA37_0006082 [Paragonimus westermani]|uniref:Uncharacterized protein n=1 Tax=Paragonimus westermani TaxID=34504 RepID=A0A5J4NN73_9TREM|nr:uncharacterized protein DEA37_0006082 [Paragonimus westermani]
MDIEGIIWAVKNGDLKSIQELSQSCPDKYGVTPLLAAVYEDHVACAKLLLNKGAKLLDPPDGSSYLDIARSPNLQKLLRDHGAV